ncbi:hypothetical protein BHM03_00055527, partial [Ensete ventricosum]
QTFCLALSVVSASDLAGDDSLVMMSHVAGNRFTPLFHILQEKATAGKQGLGIKDQPKKIAGCHWKGKKTSFSDNYGEHSDDSGGSTKRKRNEDVESGHNVQPKIKLKKLLPVREPSAIRWYRQKSTVGGRLREKKGRRRRGKEEKRRGEKGKKEIPSVVLARGSPTHHRCPRAITALGSPVHRRRPCLLFLPCKETERLLVQGEPSPRAGRKIEAT